MTTVLQELVALQGMIRETISGQLSAYRSTGDVGLLATMLPAGVLFGAVHALTPGHSKMVLAGYVAGSRIAAAKALAVAAALTAMHIGSAVVSAWFGLPLVSRALGTVGEAPLLEGLSRGILFAIGLLLIYRSMKPHRHELPPGPIVGMIAGLVPCPLTLFVMTMAVVRGIPEAGLTFATAMLAGVGFVLTVVATGTAFFRARLEQMATAYGGGMKRTVGVIQLVAGASVVATAALDLG